MIEDSGNTGAGPSRSYSAKIAPLFGRVKTYGGVPEFWLSIEGVSRPLLLLYAAHFCLSEIHNGGFLQLFWNSTGILVPEAIEGCRALGMPELARVFASAAGILGSPYPRDRESRWDALLAASSLNSEEIEQAFKTSARFYVAFETITATLRFRETTDRAWKLAETENGGFQERACRYAKKL